MNGSKPFKQHADAVQSGAFTGNLPRASLLPGEIATRPPVSVDSRDVAPPQPAGGTVYRRHLADTQWPEQVERRRSVIRERSWWRWAGVAVALVLAVWGIVLALSDSGAAPLAH